MELNKITDIIVNGIDTMDYPDFCDSFIESANYNGVPMTDEQLDELNENREFVYEKVLDFLH